MILQNLKAIFKHQKKKKAFQRQLLLLLNIQRTVSNRDLELDE